VKVHVIELAGKRIGGFIYIYIFLFMSDGGEISRGAARITLDRRRRRCSTTTTAAAVSRVQPPSACRNASARVCLCTLTRDRENVRRTGNRRSVLREGERNDDDDDDGRLLVYHRYSFHFQCHLDGYANRFFAT